MLGRAGAAREQGGGETDRACDSAAMAWVFMSALLVPSGDVAGVLRQQAPSFRSEAFAHLGVKTAGAQGLAERFRVDLVERQSFAFQRLLNVDVGMGSVVALQSRDL